MRTPTPSEFSVSTHGVGTVHRYFLDAYIGDVGRDLRWSESSQGCYSISVCYLNREAFFS